MVGGKVPPWLRGQEYELEVLPGLEEIARDEVKARLSTGVAIGAPSRPGRFGVRHRGDPRALLALRTVVAVHALARFDVPRPRALLGQTNLDRLLTLIDSVRRLHAPGSFETLRLSAAGADSPEMTRIAAVVADAFRLERVREGGQLLLALRRGGQGWEALVRLTPRPLSARGWRVCNLPGALDATVAAAMVRLAQPRAGERFVNLAAGSGTLLIERLALGPAGAAVGIELDASALACALANLRAAHADATLLQADLGALPLVDGGFDTAAADLPYGMLMGRPDQNERVYRAALGEARRVVAPGGRFVAITAAWRLFDATLADHERAWTVERTVRVSIPFARGYLKPTIYLLRRD